MKRTTLRSNTRPILYTLLFFCAALLLVGPQGRRSVAAPVPLAPMFNGIVVNSLADNTTAGNHLCTLREAIANANTDSDTTNGDCAAGSGADTITFSVTGTINLTSGLSPADNTTINGPGAASLTIKRNTGGNYSVFSITTETVTLSGMTISNGNGSFNGGGGIKNDSGTVNVNNCVLSGNTSQHGGAIDNLTGSANATTNITGCTFSSNTSNAGGAVLNDHGTMNITGSTFTANATSTSSGGGGHVATSGGTTTINGCTFSGATQGGGIANTGVMAITGSSISSNHALHSGGGIQNDSNFFDSVGFLSIINSTIGPSNDSSGGGGGLANLHGGTVNITNSTISGNTVSLGSSVGGLVAVDSNTTLTNVTVASNADAGISNEGSGTFTLYNTIVSGNGGTDIVDVTIAPASSFNLIGSTTSGGLVNGVNHNQVNVNPLLGVLQNNGGATKTHALGAGSPAIDHGSNTFVTNPPFLAAPFTDQRGTGFARLAEGNADCSTDIDIGAYEVQNTVAVPNAPDLQNGSDSGISQTDNITNDNTPTFDITGVTSGATVRLLRNCVVVASGTAAGTSITLTDPSAPAGTRSYTANQIVGGVTSATPAALSITIDTTAPTITISAPSKSTVNGSDTVTYTVTYSDTTFNTSTLANGNITLNATGTGATVAVSGGGNTRTVTLSSLTGNGTLGISIAAGTASDLAGNNAGAAGPSATFTVDTVSPTVSITPVAPDPRTTSVNSITIVFSEAVTGIDLADLSLTRDGGGNLLTGSQTLTSGDNITWTLGNLGGLTGVAGTYTLSLTSSGSGIADAANNTLAVGASDAWSVTPTTTYAESSGNCGAGNAPCYTSNQAAIDALLSGGTVNVIGGTFNEDVNLSTNVILNINGNTTINSLTISAGALNGSNGGSFTLALANGNWTNNGGTFNAGSGTVSLSGSSQTIGGTSPTTFNNLTVGAGGTILNSLNINALSSPASVTVDEMVTGVLTLDGDLTVTDPATLIMPVSAGSTGTGDVIGKVQRSGFVSGGCANAPCANTLSFGNPDNQITITGGVAPASILITMAKSAPATFAGAVQRNYNITETGGGGFTATLRLHYLDAELNGNTPESDLNLRRFNGSTWPAVVRSKPVDTTNNWVESNAVTDFSQWTFSALTPTATSGVISGRILDDNGRPVVGAVLRLSGTQTRKTISDAQGNYRFNEVETTGFYTVTPSHVNYNFNPFNRSLSQLGNQAEAVFGATFTGDGINPLDMPEYFVRQQYVDVLGREPDEVGFNFWSDRILGCGTDADCLRAQRIAVAAEFFIHQEFQQSGAFIYNLYEGALSRRPVSTEYAIDRQQVVGGPNLEAEKQALAESFVQRAEFLQKYQTNSPAAGFVDAMLLNLQQTSGVDLSNQRDTLIAHYNTGTNGSVSRSFVLRDVTENAATRDASYNQAFVLTAYFGYLRRNPDRGGQDFWLNVLNLSAPRDPGNYQRMVCAFITSAEYQLRFSAVVSHGNSECGQ